MKTIAAAEVDAATGAVGHEFLNLIGTERGLRAVVEYWRTGALGRLWALSDGAAYQLERFIGELTPRLKGLLSPDAQLHDLVRGLSDGPSGPVIRLTRYEGRRPTSPAGRLSAAARLTRVIGRERELEDLWRWMGDRPVVSVRVVTGPGGRGKTRLALELCEQAAAKGWYAGFVPGRDGLRRFTAQQDPGSWRWSCPTLVVVDYFDEQTDAVRSFLAGLSTSTRLGLKNRRNADQDQLRVLLLAREAPRDGPLWQRCFGPGGGESARIQALLEPPEAWEVPPVSDEARTPLVLAARAELGGDLVVLSTSEPLEILMTAAVGRPGSRAELARELAQRERAHVVNISGEHGVDGTFGGHMAAYVTLCQGLRHGQIITAAEEERQALGYASQEPAKVLGFLREALPTGSDGFVGRLVPDVIGCAFSELCLGAGREAAVTDAAVLRAAVVAGPFWPALGCIRGAQDLWENLDAPRLQAVRWLEKLARSTPAVVADAMDVAVEQTLVLADVAAETAASRLAVAVEPAERSRSLNTLSVRLRQLGRLEDALAASEEAVMLDRQLAEAVPDAFRPQLASSLDNLSNRQTELGRREDALVSGTEAVGLFRELTSERPEVFLPDLAKSLGNHSGRFGRLGSWDDALAHAEEATGLYRELVEARPETFRSHLARSLMNLSICLSEHGRRSEALTAVAEAVGVLRRLASTRPDAFRPDLAKSLSELSLALSKLGRREEALAAAEEAAGYYRELAKARPEAFRPGLALSLSNLSTCLSELGRWEAALAAAEEAVGLYRGLMETRPDAFGPEFAMSLSNLSSCLGDLRRHEEGLAAAEEAVAIRRELANARPATFRPDLATSLNNLSVRLMVLGRQEEALAVADEVVTIRWELAKARPDAFRPDLAWALGTRGEILLAVNEHVEAAASFAEGLDVLGEQLRAAPRAFGHRAQALLGGYFRAMQLSGGEPDSNVIEPVLEPLVSVGLILRGSGATLSPPVTGMPEVD